jgi:hypothetical protein
VSGDHEKRRVESSALMNQHVRSVIGQRREGKGETNRSVSASLAITIPSSEVPRDAMMVSKIYGDNSSGEAISGREKKANLSRLGPWGSAHIKTFVIWRDIQSERRDHGDSLLSSNISILSMLHHPFVKTL